MIGPARGQAEPRGVTLVARSPVDSDAVLDEQSDVAWVERLNRREADSPWSVSVADM